MTAAAAARVTPEKASKPFAATKSLPVKTATTIYEGTMVALDSTGYAVPAATDTDHRIQGVATDTVVNAGASGAKHVKVAIGVFMMNNSAAADAIAVTERGSECYIVDDNTVAKTDGTGTRSRAGNIEDVESAGVWVSIHPYGFPNGTATQTGAETLTNKTLTTPTIGDMTNANHDHADAAGGGQIDVTDLIGVAKGDIAYGDGVDSVALLNKGTARQVLRMNAGATAPEWGPMGLISGGASTAFASHDSAITPEGGKFYTIPACDGDACTVTITTTSLVAGDIIAFVADGTNNDQTVQYVDTATAITAAKTASKRHCAMFVFDGTNLYPVGEVSP